MMNMSDNPIFIIFYSYIHNIYSNIVIAVGLLLVTTRQAAKTDQGAGVRDGSGNQKAIQMVLGEATWRHALMMFNMKHP